MRLLNYLQENMQHIICKVGFWLMEVQQVVHLSEGQFHPQLPVP